MLLYRARRYGEAAAEFGRGLAAPNADRPTVARLHYNPAPARLALGDRDAAQAETAEALRLGSARGRRSRSRGA